MNAAPTINPELRSVLKQLRLGQILDALPERILLAEKQSMSFEDLLLMVLGDEVSRRESSAAARRARDAGLDPDMMLERWDKAAAISYDKRLFAELASLRFIDAHRHVVVLGPVGTGKTFLATALGHLACKHGYHVLFQRADAHAPSVAPKPARQLTRCADDSVVQCGPAHYRRLCSRDDVAR
jgi:DNA replication protein DnaC